MIIVVEGCDNSGKSTIAAKLAKRLRGLLIKSEHIPPLNEHLQEYMEVLQAAEMYGNGVVVSDRHHVVSEPIYGDIIRGGHKLKEVTIKQALDQISAFVYCRPSDELILGTMAERQQMAGVTKNASALLKGYDQFFGSDFEYYRQKVWTYDYTKDSEEALAREIQIYARLP